MKSIVVTGVSSGIGWGAAKTLVNKGFRVFGSVRKQADAERLQKELGPNFIPLIFDVTDAQGVHKAAEQVAAALGGETLFGLVNNAGIAVPGPLLYLKVDDFRHQLEVNLTGQLIVTQAFAPLLGADPARKGNPGRIVMISSVGGKRAAPFIGPYHASKFGLEGFSESLRRELMVFGIDVIVIAPGAVATAIWDKAETVDTAPYAHTVYAPVLGKLKSEMARPGKKNLKPEKLSRVIHRALTTANPKTRYTITPEPLLYLLLTLLPKRLSDRLCAGRLGLMPKKR